ncbi:MAG: HAD family hydrolase [Planctomycetota bacterium]|jgi:Cof subfamily protein (haloacid dehalogenase superfamily)
MTPAIRHIACDIDGTLLADDGSLPRENALTLRAAHDAGIRVSIISVRMRHSASRVLRELDVPHLMVAQGGSVIWDEGGAVIERTLIDHDLARAVAAFCDEHGYGLLATVNEQHHYGPTFEFMLPGVGYARVNHASNLATVEEAPTRIMISGAVAVEAVREHFADAPLSIHRHYDRAGNLLDAVVTDPQASKETGLRHVCERLGIPVEETMALGDSESDIGMIRAAGVGVAMGNADDPVKAAADWIAPISCEAGVAVAVRRFVGGLGRE